MKNTQKIVVGILGTGLYMTSCSPKYYAPNSQNVPLMTQQGQTNLTVAGNTDRVELQGAYAVSNNIAVMLNGGLFIPQNEENGNGGSGRLLEAGAGYYTSLSEHFVFEAYGLAGLGRMENHFPYSSQVSPPIKGNISANLFRAGIQPNLGYRSRYFTAAVSSRLMSLNYSNPEGDLIYNGADQVTYLKNNKTHFLIEPALTLRGGLEHIKLQVQLGTSFNISNPDFMQDKGWLTIGLNMNLATLSPKK